MNIKGKICGPCRGGQISGRSDNYVFSRTVTQADGRAIQTNQAAILVGGADEFNLLTGKDAHRCHPGADPAPTGDPADPQSATAPGLGQRDLAFQMPPPAASRQRTTLINHPAALVIFKSLGHEQVRLQS